MWTEFLEHIRSLSGTNEKADYIKACKEDEMIKKLLIYTYDPAKTYGIRASRIDMMVGDEFATDDDLKDYFKILDKMANRDLVGNRAIEVVTEFVNQFYESEDMLKILDGSLDIGVGKTVINKAIPNLISVFKVTLAKKYKWNGELPFKVCCVSQKFDGVRCVIIKQGNKVEFLSRTGKYYSSLEKLRPEILALPYNNVVLDGEIIRGDGTGKYFQSIVGDVRRKKSKKHPNLEDYTIDNYTFQAFDIMSLDDFYGRTKTSYLNRTFYYEFEEGEYLKDVEHMVISEYSDLEKLWERAMEKGWEGLMLRNGDAPYEGKRSGNLLKMKAMQDEEFEVMGFQEGTGRLKNSLGAMGVNVNGKTVWVGSGYSDEQRDMIWNDQGKYIGEDATIQYFELTKDGSLRFPVFKGFRGV